MRPPADLFIFLNVNSQSSLDTGHIALFSGIVPEYLDLITKNSACVPP